MKQFFTFLFALTTLLGFSQDGFKKKLKQPAQTPLTQHFIEIDGSKNTKAGRMGAVPSLSTKFLNRYKITQDPESGGVIQIENLSKPNPSKSGRKTMQVMGMDFLNEVKAKLRIENPAQELEMVDMNTDELGMTHIKIHQKYNNIEVYGSEILLHSKGEQIDLLNGRSYPTPQLNSTAPSISADKAIELAMNDVSKHAIVQKSGVAAKLLAKQADKADLIIYHLNEKPDAERLVYHATIKPNLLERWEYFVDANSGEILDKYNHTCSLDGPFTAKARDLNNVERTINIHQVGNTYYMIDTSRPMYNRTASKLPNDPMGAIWTIDAQNSRANEDLQFSHITSPNGANWSPTAVSAHHNGGLAYEYYRTKHNRNSLDGKGSTIISVINIADEDGKGMDNAFWTGEFMGYGNGRDAFRALAGSLDVAGHEMTHGVVENTARLEYRNQSGALNESFSDVFGALVEAYGDPNDTQWWRIGEDVTRTTAFPSGALRNLQNPNQGGPRDPGYQPKTMSQYAFLRDTEDEDNGGVHVNSGIPNYAFYLFASNANVGLARAEQVYYRALTKYLTRTSKFVDARLAVVRSASELYGGDASAVTQAARAAFDAVGILDPNASTGGTPTSTTPNTTPTTIPTNPGADYILVFDPTDNKLYNGKVGEQLRPITSRGCLSKPSITDDGLFAYYVAADKNIYRLGLTSPFTETRINMPTNGIWGNVAISKDGKRMAALTEAGDKFMYVVDFESNKYVRFTLYNPTYSTGVKSGDVQYADSFEWDYSGEYVIYDAYNKIRSVSGEIDFWDVGSLHAWDNQSKNFSKGTIEKLFNLEDGESIGNPSFAKTSPDILAFDYYTEDEPDTYYQITVNIETGNVQGIYENTDVGYPGYSKADDRMLFNSTRNRKEVVMMIGIGRDKLTASGSASVIYEDAKWAVWYAQGNRALPTKTDQTITFAAISDRNGGESFNISATATSNLPVQFSVVSGDATISGNRVTLGSNAGKVTIRAIQVGNQVFNSASLDRTFCILPKAPVVSQNGNTLTVSGGTTFQWYVNGNLNGGQTTATTRLPDLSGTYTARAVVDGCLSPVSNAVTIQIVLGKEKGDDIRIKTFPNPATEYVKFELPFGVNIKKIQLYDQSGRLISEQNQIEDNSLKVNQLKSGNYLLKLETNKGEFTNRVVIE
ncbi:MAG: M4 family metallopeptidase [Spirosomaceae bacterium]|nr:M4 family metallopeptidase [Spirosomataceae bacterium]